MEINKIFLLVSILASITVAQFDQFKQVDLNDQVNFASEVTPVAFSDNVKLFVKRGFFIYTYETHSQFDSLELMDNSLRVRIPSTDDSYAIASKNNSVYLAAIDLHGTIILSVSEDQGINFTSKEILDSVTANRIDLSLSENGLFILTLLKDSTVVDYTSKDKGLTWSGPYSIQNTIDTSSYAKTFQNNDGPITAIVSKTQNDATSLFSLTSDDEGETWGNEQLIIEAQSPITKFDLITDDTGETFLIYNKILRNNAFDIAQSDVFYITSSDGTNWSDEVQFTSYLKDDNIGGVTLYNSKPLLFMSSTRFGYTKINQYASVIGETIDNEPPAVFDFEYEYSPETENTIMRVYADDLDGIDSVSINIKGISHQLFDDGNNSDLNANDNIYGFGSSSSLIGETAVIDVNNIYLPFNNSGILASVHPTIDYNIECDVQDTKAIKSSFSNSFTVAESSPSNMQFTKALSGSLMFSGGFILSGYDNDSLWSNGVAANSLVEDYVPGNVNSQEGGPSTQIYNVKRSDPTFGLSWQNWKYAVEAGAYFYDGNNNGKYDPEDLNGNGTWDLDEDKPDLLYDETYFSVINDGVEAKERRYSTVSPKGIEIRQTIFASSQNSLLSNTVFIRYSLLNTGVVNDTLTDVIFSMLSDIDIGGIAGYGDDLSASDTTLNSVYGYNDGPDPQFGDNPPAVFLSLIQGPKKYTGNENDIAYNRFGPDLGIEEFTAFKNLDNSSSICYFSSDPDVGDANDKQEIRNYQLGKTRQGNYVDPCNFPYGHVLNQECKSIDPTFWFSGDPVANIGWLNTTPQDQRQILSTGNFDLIKNNPVDIIVAYTAEQGFDALNSITKTRSTVSYLHEEYENNFSTLVGVEENPEELTKSFYLSQNYPNPFNPTTNIKFSIPHSQFSTLKVYDILGREVATLFNEVKTKGTYQVTFDASQFASGVYFYRLISGDFVQTKKMILLR